jgi:hypothetical protein
MQILKDIGIVLLGLILGGTLNMLLVQTGMIVFPAPEGINISTEAGLKLAMGKMSFEHFIFPFLAHALGTLFGDGLQSDSQSPNTYQLLIVSACCFY